MRFSSDIKSVREISRDIEKLLRGARINESIIFDIRLSAEEALKNSIIHGNKRKRDLPLFVDYKIENNKFMMEIEDAGEGFKPGGVPDPTKEENLLTAGGRGVFLVNKLMDKVEYKGRGNKIFMVKFLSNKKGDPA